MLTEITEYRHKIEEEVKAMQNEMKKNTQGTNSEGNSNQWFGAERRNKHSTRTEWRNKDSYTRNIHAILIISQTLSQADYYLIWSSQKVRSFIIPTYRSLIYRGNWHTKEVKELVQSNPNSIEFSFYTKALGCRQRTRECEQCNVRSDPGPPRKGVSLG